jgi:hypothetical protein
MKLAIGYYMVGNVGRNTIENTISIGLEGFIDNKLAMLLHLTFFLEDGLLLSSI